MSAIVAACRCAVAYVSDVVSSAKFPMRSVYLLVQLTCIGEIHP